MSTLISDLPGLPVNTQECTLAPVPHRQVARVTKYSQKGGKGYSNSLRLAIGMLLRLGRRPHLFITLIRVLGNQESKMTMKSLSFLICVIILV